ncbi:hypothetical protein [Paractinoplanes lichenicola]|uniref:Uncharacterized protein n=1 Tax=Paractinoplanes lichenicola TaxID=2802976 RepID=A0ABS1VU57_9ACTN|nr:hypothetical protein [Actinoplanes lichenicola]MBL7258011.1 hypothetical protein [Actinoplanes lichenicola]
MTEVRRPAVVPVQLDLREFRTVPDGPDGYLELWKLIEPTVHTLQPQVKDTWRLDLPDGPLTVRFVDPASAPARLDRTTPFAVRGVVEPPVIRYKCASCAAAKITRYGPFVCSQCREAKLPDPLCDDHAVIVDLNFGRVTCRRHRPRCECGEAGSFWCGGPRCKGARAWCDRHRKALPGNADRAYCPQCHDRRFPACAATGCASTGSMSCEHTDAAGRSCARRQCLRHGFRWQVYGPRRTGLAVCQEHRAGLAELGRAELIRQVVVATALRRGHGSGFRLPTLPAFRHMLINVRRDPVDIPAVAELVDAVRRDLAGTPHAAVFDESYGRAMRAAIETAAQDREAGLKHFARLRQYLRGAGRTKLAEQMTYAFFTSRSNLLFVRVPDDFEKQFEAYARKMSGFLSMTVKRENA